MPIRVHELLLGLAGRLDDDGLADARELLASAELDRSLEFIVGCLAAGRITITGAQRRELEALFNQVHLDPAVLGRLVVDDAAAAVHHRFGGGELNGRSSCDGVADAVRRVLEVLPDVRSVWAVWRLTPAGAVSGPVPHRVVLVGVGPGGFAPATAYRLENALRRADIHASVEVLRDGTDAPEYHRSAMQYATQVPVGRPAGRSPVTSSRPSSGLGEPPLFTSAAEPRTTAPASAAALVVEPRMPVPAPVSEPRRPAPAHAPATEPRMAPVLPAEPRMAPAPPAEPRTPAPAADPLAHAVQHLANPPQSTRRSRLDSPADSGSRVEQPSSVPPRSGSPWVSDLPEPTTPKPPQQPAAAAAPAGDANHAPRSAPTPPSTDDSPVGVGSGYSGPDSTLSEQERDLLRQLQEELARREQEESAAGSGDDAR